MKTGVPTLPTQCQVATTYMLKPLAILAQMVVLKKFLLQIYAVLRQENK